MVTVVELIAREIKRRLERIKIANGYTFNNCGVTRPDRLGVEVNPADGLIVLAQQDSVRNEDLSLPGNPPATAYTVTFEIHCFVRLSDKKLTEYQSTQSDRSSQLIKALTTEATDTGRWFTWVEKAIDTQLGDIKNFSVGDGDHNGITLTIEVTYRTDENDPYQVRA